jgi:hypothetical protein
MKKSDIHFLLIKDGERQQVKGKVKADKLITEGWRIEARAVMGKLASGTSGVDLPLLLQDGEDNLPDVLKPFQTIDDLHALWLKARESLMSQLKPQLSRDERIAFVFLTEILAEGEDGVRILKAIRKHEQHSTPERRQIMADFFDYQKLDNWIALLAKLRSEQAADDSAVQKLRRKRRSLGLEPGPPDPKKQDKE